MTLNDNSFWHYKRMAFGTGHRSHVYTLDCLRKVRPSSSAEGLGIFGPHQSNMCSRFLNLYMIYCHILTTHSDGACSVDGAGKSVMPALSFSLLLMSPLFFGSACWDSQKSIHSGPSVIIMTTLQNRHKETSPLASHRTDARCRRLVILTGPGSYTVTFSVDLEHCVLCQFATGKAEAHRSEAISKSAAELGKGPKSPDSQSVGPSTFPSQRPSC